MQKKEIDNIKKVNKGFGKHVAKSRIKLPPINGMFVISDIKKLNQMLMMKLKFDPEIPLRSTNLYYTT